MFAFAAASVSDDTCHISILQAWAETVEIILAKGFFGSGGAVAALNMSAIRQSSLESMAYRSRTPSVAIHFGNRPAETSRVAASCATLILSLPLTVWERFACLRVFDPMASELDSFYGKQASLQLLAGSGPEGPNTQTEFTLWQAHAYILAGTCIYRVDLIHKSVDEWDGNSCPRSCRHLMTSYCVSKYTL
jgi:hypothetical protein